MTGNRILFMEISVTERDQELMERWRREAEEAILAPVSGRSALTGVYICSSLTVPVLVSLINFGFFCCSIKMSYNSVK